MDKYIYDEKNGLWYELQGDYYLPCLKLPEKETAHIGIWGQRHLRYLKQHRKVLYSNLLISGKLNDYLADLNEQAAELFSRLVKQLSEKESVTEALKAENLMLWVQKMNSIRNTAMEVVSNDLIYA
ncbi:TnpV protein [[Clostridium] leptum]|uniref:TnpV protein n=1 Tax=[Clostridium] leptum TaxID=1535 RepID=A0A412AZI6_9FIRM|nr:TnpV protein [[Clostridium] leptum]